MILLDTNVLSEFMRPAPTKEVVAWLDAQVSGQVWVCAVTRAEIELGVALVHGLVLATRNERDFELIDGLSVMNPWIAGS